ncbi:MAG: ParB N-terminal domain-containing protein [Planctomycetes bacterium]|nr:ParB N-terminal domain-containing protein [Planctomycetota bacterium]
MAKKAAAAKKKATTKKGPARKKATRKPPVKVSAAMSAADVAGAAPAEVAALGEQVKGDGGAVLAHYREPFGGHSVLLVALPIDKVEPTPYQRDVSAPHVKRLARSIEKVGRFLDPVIAVRHDGRYWVPNGGHRLAALKEAGGTSITALLVPEREVAHKILALNTEKAHNLKEKALEVLRLERALAAAGDPRPEAAFDLELEEGALVTIGAAYERRPRLSGSSYNAILRRVDALLDRPLPEALALREGWATKVLEADDRVSAVVERLKARGLRSPYLRQFVVARLNPLGKFAGADAPDTVDGALDALIERAGRFDADKVREEDLQGMGGGGGGEGEGEE